ncbi:unnamed protein product [Heligmosomoides polygyrus]|uniref:C3HC-type domain-containing protein n=1 Tax=Heligmosomoides polygyrus TaxID=6339 RepID=A0A183FI61_HELPZ|nr:unnamed protein product [Heligmosomoides polygyrus]
MTLLFQFEFWAGNEITPRELAVHGWECKARDQVQCIACKQFLCTSLPKITEVDINVYSKCMRWKLNAYFGYTMVCGGQLMDEAVFYTSQTSLVPIHCRRGMEVELGGKFEARGSIQDTLESQLLFHLRYYASRNIAEAQLLKFEVRCANRH